METARLVFPPVKVGSRYSPTKAEFKNSSAGLRSKMRPRFPGEWADRCFCFAQS